MADAAEPVRAAPLDPLDPTNQTVYESAYWLYPLALYHFQRAGDSETARAALRLARSQNHHVVLLLLGRTVMPREDPDSYSPGSFDEAVLYACVGRSSWQQVPGALEWLRGGKPAQPKPRPAVGPDQAGSTLLRDLLGAWIADDSTYQTPQTKKNYRATIARLLDRLEQRGLTLVGAALTPEEVNGYLDSLEAGQRGAARNRIRVWCEWLERRGVIAKNPLPLGGG